MCIILHQPGAELAADAEDAVSGMGMVGRAVAPVGGGGPEAAEEADWEDEDEAEDEVLPDEARPFDTTAERWNFEL